MRTGPAPLEQLDRFLEEVEQLKHRTLLQQGLKSDLTLTMKDGIVTVTTEGPENDLELDLWRSFLMSFRLFTAPKETVFLGRVLNLAVNHIHDPELTEALERGQDAWRKEDGLGEMRLNWNGKDLTNRHIADLWMVGVYFHTHEPNKTAFIRSLDPFHRTLLQGWFRSHVVAVTHLIGDTANLIRQAKERGVLKAEPRFPVPHKEAANATE